VQGASATDCISHGNGKSGIETLTNSWCAIINCDSYNNSGDGLRVEPASNTPPHWIENTNVVKNGGWGINYLAVAHGVVRNLGIGAGTQVNTSGAKSIGVTNGVDDSGTVTYASDVTPWTDPVNGDFRISLAAAKAAGRGSFTQTAASYAGTVGYPDIGAAQSQASGGGIPVARGMHGGMR
jgi:hypothetical protein